MDPFPSEPVRTDAGETIPSPAVTVNVSSTPEAGRPSASVSSAIRGLGKGCPTVVQGGAGSMDIVNGPWGTGLLGPSPHAMTRQMQSGSGLRTRYNGGL